MQGGNLEWVFWLMANGVLNTLPSKPTFYNYFELCVIDSSKFRRKFFKRIPFLQIIRFLRNTTYFPNNVFPVHPYPTSSQPLNPKKYYNYIFFNSPSGFFMWCIFIALNFKYLASNNFQPQLKYSLVNYWVCQDFEQRRSFFQ
jgi:hypothetical protein